MKRFILLIPLLGVAASPVAATTMVLSTDSELFDQAAFIVEGVVLSIRPSATGHPATEYSIRVERALKGLPAAGDLIVRVPGGVGADGRELVVWGAPEMKVGERALLFLGKYPDGVYGPLHLAMGVFHAVWDGQREVALRDLSEMEEVSGGKTVPAQEPGRNFRRFAQWLADRAAGLRRPADYFFDGPVSGLRPAREKFTYLAGIRMRWTEFDLGASVGWRSHVDGQPGLPSGGAPELQVAMQAWNDDADTNISYRYDGTTTATEGFLVFDGVNAILFEDPNEEATGRFVCSSPGQGSGVLAIGGPWFAAGPEPRQIVGADIVVNDGAGCWFSTSKRAEQVYGHELGHTLGLGHSQFEDALMFAFAHRDDRGASLHSDDRDGIFSLYPDGSGYDFFTLTPCRVLDTRDQPLPLGAGLTRIVPMAGSCGIPSGASAISVNLTVIDPSAEGELTAFAANAPRPKASAISYQAGRTRANNAILNLGNGALAFFCNQPAGSVHLIIDVNGYFLTEGEGVAAAEKSMAPTTSTKP